MGFILNGPPTTLRPDLDLKKVNPKIVMWIKEVTNTSPYFYFPAITNVLNRIPQKDLRIYSLGKFVAEVIREVEKEKERQKKNRLNSWLIFLVLSIIIGLLANGLVTSTNDEKKSISSNVLMK